MECKKNRMEHKRQHRKHEMSEHKIEKALGLKSEPEVGILESTSTEQLRQIMRDN